MQYIMHDGIARIHKTVSGPTYHSYDTVANFGV